MDQHIVNSRTLCLMDIPSVKHILAYKLVDYRDSRVNMSKSHILFVKSSNGYLDHMVIDRMDSVVAVDHKSVVDVVE